METKTWGHRQKKLPIAPTHVCASRPCVTQCHDHHSLTHTIAKVISLYFLFLSFTPTHTQLKSRSSSSTLRCLTLRPSTWPRRCMRACVGGDREAKRSFFITLDVWFNDKQEQHEDTATVDPISGFAVGGRRHFNDLELCVIFSRCVVVSRLWWN